EDLRLEALVNGGGDLLGERRGRGARRCEHRVAALQKGAHVFEAEVFIRLLQRGHGDHASAADIDAAEKRREGRHSFAPQAWRASVSDRNAPAASKSAWRFVSRCMRWAPARSFTSRAPPLAFRKARRSQAASASVVIASHSPRRISVGATT